MRNVKGIITKSDQTMWPCRAAIGGCDCSQIVLKVYNTSGGHFHFEIIHWPYMTNLMYPVVRNIKIFVAIPKKW